MSRREPDLTKHADIIPVEVALIGAVLAEAEATVPPLMPIEFFLGAHQVIWDAVLSLQARGERPTCVTAQYELARSGQLAAAGGPAKLVQCWAEGHIPAYVPSLARQIRECARERQLEQLGHELLRQGLGQREIARRLEELPGPLTSGVYEPAHTWRSMIAGWDAPRILTGLSKVDALLGGFRAGQLAVIGARTSHGKTAFVAHLALRVAEAGHTVEVFTLEEPTEEIQARMQANLTQLPKGQLDAGLLDERGFHEHENAVRRLQDLALIITALDSLRSLEEDAVVGAISQSKADVIIVDHLQKVVTPGDSRVYGIERFLNRLHAIALRHQRAVIVTAQLSREMDAQRRAPELRDLRDSGATEQSARKILLLYWPCRHHADRAADEYEIIVAKNSSGGTGSSRVSFNALRGRFSDEEEAYT